MSEPVADVYAGDLASADASSGAEGRGFDFSIEADAEEDAFFRIAGVLNLAHRCPSKASLMLLEAEGALCMRVRIDDINVAAAEALRRKLDQLTCMRNVELTVLDARSA